MSGWQKQLKILYGKDSPGLIEQVNELLSQAKKKNPAPQPKSGRIFTERDAMLICYADHVQRPGEKSLQTMQAFLRQYAPGLVNRVHFLPFYPWSSDDGFSVKDYYRLDKRYGGWQDIAAISRDFGLMFDCVANHMSAHSEWFQACLKGDPKYKEYFIGFDRENFEKHQPDFDRVFRPRKHPLFTEFKTREGKKYFWTTFSEDQVDLDFSNPEVFLEFVKILLFYVSRGASAIRLDAIAYAWKKLGTNCFDLREAHFLVKAWRGIIEQAAPQVWVITETVLPHEQNISYFGGGRDEAHLVYHFQLETLLLYTLLSGSSDTAARWLSNIEYPSPGTSYLNLSVSHDGIHTIPARGILSEEQMRELAEDVAAKGGQVLERDAGGGRTEIYEFNITYPSAIGRADKYLASQAIMLALKGVPLIYFNNLFGQDNWSDGPAQLGYSRAVNRQKFDYKEIKSRLDDLRSRPGRIYRGYSRMLRARAAEPLFSPLAGQEILLLDPRIMAIKRHNKKQALLALTNVSNEEVVIKSGKIKDIFPADKAIDILDKGAEKEANKIRLGPYQNCWLKTG